jgi:probable HAF family extracellular repeat protein
MRNIRSHMSVIRERVPHQSVSAGGINDAGSPLQLGVLSYAYYTRAFIWAAGRMTDLGSLGGTVWLRGQGFRGRIALIDLRPIVR